MFCEAICTPMTVLDWMVLAVFLLSMVLGAVRGLVYEVLSLLGWIVALWVARTWGLEVGNALPVTDWTPALRSVAGFVLLFVLVLFGWGLVSALLKKLMAAVGLAPVDRALGALFGALRSVLLLLVLTLVVQGTALHTYAWWREALVSPWLESALALVRPSLPPQWERYVPGAQSLGREPQDAPALPTLQDVVH